MNEILQNRATEKQVNTIFKIIILNFIYSNDKNKLC